MPNVSVICSAVTQKKLRDDDWKYIGFARPQVITSVTLSRESKKTT